MTFHPHKALTPNFRHPVGVETMENEAAGQMLTGRDLREIAAKMMNIDKQELVEAGVITGTPGGSDWERFNRDPLIFICKLNDDRRDILAAMVSPYRSAP